MNAAGVARSAWFGRVRPGRDRTVDVLLAVVCAISTAGPAMDSTLFGGSPYLPWHPPPPVTVALGVLIGVVAMTRRRRPLLLVAAALVAWVIAAAYPAVVVGQYGLGAHERSRRAVAAVTAVVTVAVAVPFRRQGLDSIIPLSVAVCLAPSLLGLWAAARRDLLAGLRERADRAEREQHLLAERARADERARIAHDMHDVVAHRVSLMVLHATAIEVAADAERPVLARRIRAIGRDALEELRALVGVLRAGEPGAPLAPQPTLADLPGLAEQSRAAGTPVTVESAGRPRGLPSMVEQAGYRVVQEALTNVHKHAGAAATVVQVRYGTDTLRVTVHNAPPGHAVAAALPAGGHGLAGLRERVHLVGGRLTTGATRDGGFEVTATIPVPPQDAQ